MNTHADFYSVVLKYCSPDRKAVVKKLQAILLRGSRAIQLALENVPCVLIYKERADKVLKVLTICRDAGAAAVLFAPDMQLNASINTIYRDFHKLPKDTQIFLQSFPHKLWIGENITGVYTVLTQDKGKGLLVVGEHALYFLGRQYDWLAVSYHQLQGIYLTHEALEIEYLGSEATELFYSDDNHYLEAAFAQLQNARKRAQRRWRVDTHCAACGFSAREGLFAAVYDACLQCGQPLLRKINDHKSLI